MIFIYIILSLQSFVNANNQNVVSKISMDGCCIYDELLVRNYSQNTCKSVQLNVSYNSIGYMSGLENDVMIMNIGFPSSWTDSKKGIFVDDFLAPRPWWTVLYERYNWSSTDDRIGSDVDVKLLRMSPIEKPLRAMAAIQYPTDCLANQMRVRCIGNMNEYGNERGNTQTAYGEVSGAIFDLVSAGGAHWVSEKSCPTTFNKFRCAFLPSTNCTTDMVRNCNPGAFFLKGNSMTSNETTREEFMKTFKPVTFPEAELQSGCAAKRFNLFESFNFSGVKSTCTGIDVRQNMFYVAHLFRMNHDYRSRVAHMIAKFRKKHKFDEDAECIAFHIRRGDRAIHNINIVEHCENSRKSCGKEYECLNNKNKYFDLGCHTAHPFGALNFSMFTRAAEILVRDEASLANVRNIVVMTNDEKWAIQHSATYTRNFTFFVLPHHGVHHGVSSVHHGVVNQMHLEVTRQCSGFVAHGSSAFAELVHQYMCFRHGPRNRPSFGKCPPFFDFSQTA